jgi:hypothetical protein
MFTIYLRDVVPAFAPFPAAGPIRPYEVSPLLQVTQWHEHLELYMVDRKMRVNLLNLVDLNPKMASLAINNVYSVVWKYMQDVRDLAKNTPLGMRCMLQEYPR